MKERPILFTGAMVRAILDGRKTQTRRIAKPRHSPSLLDGSWTDEYVLDPGNCEWLMRDCPYGKPGDRLWVRETWREGYAGSFFYRADEPWHADADWRPSIHMPRGASRITLEIVSVRVERLQDISEEDARAEGVEAVSLAAVPRQAAWSCRQDFAQLWDSINAKRGYGWQTNPWVWVIEFRRAA